MFDDLFLFAAFYPSTEGKRLLALSIRQEEEFERFRRFGWKTFITQNVMVTKPFNIGELPVELISMSDEDIHFSCILGDLAAYTPENIELVRKLSAPVVKVNFITSPIDGSAFLPAKGSDRMLESAMHLADELRSMGYMIMASTWYRHDQQLRVWELGDGAGMELFPFNMVAVKDPGIARSFQYMSEVYAEQEKRTSGEHKALEDRLNGTIDEEKKRVERCKGYIAMLEDAMIALQPSEKIKLG